MDNTERLYNIDDTVKYLTHKMETEIRWIKNILRQILDKKCKCKNEECCSP